MVRTLGKYVMPAICLLALALYAPQAKASSVEDFSCGSVASCAGSVVQTGTGSTATYSTTGISLVASAPWALGGASQSGSTFTLTFDTSTGNISLTDGAFSISGTMVAGSLTVTHTSSSKAVDFAVDWSGGLNGIGHVGFLLSAGKPADSVDVSVVTPEPASLLLLGTGLLGMGAAVRRRLLG